MIASQKIGTSFKNALGYNWNKLFIPDKEKRAELLVTNFVSADPALILREVELIRSQRPDLGRYVYHTSINFHVNDVLDNDTMLEIAHAYLKGMGFTDNQYLIFRHHDAGHPHLHLLANRVTFSGDVVSDSNNYKRSEAILRKMEQQYTLIAVEQSNHWSKERNNKVSVSQASKRTKERSNAASMYQPNVRTKEQHKRAPLRAPLKDVLEMVLRTGEPSVKMLLQEKLTSLLSQPGLTLPQFIRNCEDSGVSLLFNQASTGRISGITYFYQGFKMKGQALGHRFKWAEIIKLLNYEQVRDGKAVSQENERTRAIYGEQGAVGTAARGMGVADSNGGANAAEFDEQSQTGTADRNDAAGRGSTDYETGTSDGRSAQGNAISDPADEANTRSDGYGNYITDGGLDIQIADDIDDEAIHGRNRRREKKVRTNRR